MYAVTQPIYNNNNLQDFTAWLNDNLVPVATYAIQLGVTDDELDVFAQIQYDRAVMLDRMEFELALSYQLQQVAA
jgi:hypothetical protein